MRTDNITDSLSSALYSSIYLDLPDIEYKRKINSDKISLRRPRKSEVTVYHFEQMWGNTALGFRGMGGASMTSAYTTVIIMKNKNIACIYFDGQLAYKCNLSTEFWNRLFKFNIPGQTEAFDKFKILE